MVHQTATPRFATMPVAAFLDQLASDAPTPGGGAAAALAGAMSAGLVSMVCNLTVGRPRYAEVETTLREVLARSDAARERLVALADDDAAAYSIVAEAFRLPRSDEDARARRAAAIQSALVQAAKPPLSVMKECRSLVPLCLEAAAHGNAAVVSDAGVAVELAAAALRSSIINLRVNLSQIKDQAFVSASEGEIQTVEEGLQDEIDRTIGIVRAKIAPRSKP